MEKGFVFLANSSKPTAEKYNSRDDVHPSNVSRPCLEKALSMGYKVFYGINRNRPEDLNCDLPVTMYDEHIYRSIFAFHDNIIAYRNLSNVIKDGNVFAIHCNTPVGGLIGRLCGKRYKVSKVIYTAHGFHFYKGAPFLQKTIIKWAEQIMARWTDAIITMNREDYEASQKFHLKKDGKVFFVHGVGITLSDFDGVGSHREEKRQELNLSEDEIALISAGDLVARKNYATAIKAVAKCADKRIHYYICGRGEDESELKLLAKDYNVEDQVHFLGFRTDIKDLMAAADIFLFTTKQEGMPRSMMEAMACGLPCIASSIRGNVDLIEDKKNGFLYAVDDIDGFAEGIMTLTDDKKLRDQMGLLNKIKINEYDVSVVKKEISDIYDAVLKDN